MAEREKNGRREDLKMINIVIKEKYYMTVTNVFNLGFCISICKQAFYPFKFYNGLLPSNRCIVPSLHLVNTEVDFGRCFLKYPYEKTVQLVNPDDLPGCYEVLPQVSYFILFSV